LAPLRFHVREVDAGARLDRILAGRAEIGSRALAERLIEHGNVTVEGAPRIKSYRVVSGERIDVDVPEHVPLAPEELDIPIAWQDEHLLVVDKPAGIVVHPAGTTTTGTLVNGLLTLGADGGEEDRPGIVHRLDKDTSGLMIVARSEEAHERLQELIRGREVERRYTALVRGTPKSRTGRIEAPIGRDRHDRTRHSIDTDTPRDAVTWFELVETVGPRSVLELRLDTGRTHQIRVHLEAIGLPISGDPVYGVAGDLDLARQFLHASRLRFVHPFTGEEIDVHSPLPDDLAQALERARGGG
jgi:23S rRNA pseudouridine1911/1915/1917 synthase